MCIRFIHSSKNNLHVSKHKHKITNYITKLVSKLECVYYYMDGLKSTELAVFLK